MKGLEKAIEQARNMIDDDPSLAIYIVKDFNELKNWRLDNLAWSMYQNGTTRREVIWFLNLLMSNIIEEREMQRENLIEWHTEHYDRGDN